MSIQIERHQLEMGLDAILAMAGQYKEMYPDKSVPVFPLVLIKRDNAIVEVTMPPMSGPEEFRSFIERLMAKKRIQGYVVVLESEGLINPDPEAVAIWMREHDDVSDHPNKVPCLIGYASCPGHEIIKALVPNEKGEYKPAANPRCEKGLELVRVSWP